LLIYRQRSGKTSRRWINRLAQNPGLLPQGELKMRNLNKILLALAVSGTALLNAPLAYADKYQTNNYYYGNDRYDNDHGRHQHRHDNEGKRCHKHKKVVNNHYYYDEPVHERVVVVERPVYYETEVRYEEPPRYYDDRASYPQNDPGYRSATPMVVGGIIGGVLGNQVGKGRGKDVATIAGVILGGSIGRDISYRQ